MACVLKIFKDSLLPCNYFSMLASSALTTMLISSMLLVENDIAVSPAYIVACALLRGNGTSFI